MKVGELINKMVDGTIITLIFPYYEGCHTGTVEEYKNDTFDRVSCRHIDNGQVKKLGVRCDSNGKPKIVISIMEEEKKESLTGYSCFLDAAEALFSEKEATQKEAAEKAMQDEINKLKCDLEENKKYIESLKTAYGQAYEENEKLKMEVESLRKECLEQKERANALTSNLESQRAYIESQRVEILNLEKNEKSKANCEEMYDQACKTNEALEKINKMLEIQNAELKTENITLKKKLNSQCGGGGDSAGGGGHHKQYYDNPGSGGSDGGSPSSGVYYWWWQ